MLLTRTLGCLALAIGASAAGSLLAAPAYLIADRGDRRVLMEVEAGAAPETIASFGRTLIYGWRQDTLAAISGTEKGFWLQVIDLPSRQTRLSVGIPAQVLMPMSGVEPWIALDATEASARFLTVSLTPPVAYGVSAVPIASGKLEALTLPKSVGGPRIRPLAGRLGISDETSAQLLFFDESAKAFVPLSRRQSRERSPDVHTEDWYVFLPRTGVVRVEASGSVVVLTDDALRSVVREPQAIGGPIVAVQGGVVAGQAVLVVALAGKDGATSRTLVAIDPATGAESWRETLPFRSRSFALQPDGTLDLVDLDRPGLVRLDRAQKHYSRLLEFKPSGIEATRTVVIQPAD
ncbi:MAG TPA: hypothetical protein VJS92_12120 [Candidatus Polarisedimenticolaceae bacterium]|nr:hypothetical protein [Candidatus Polarisedimenticolaceae bacterium]